MPNGSDRPPLKTTSLLAGTTLRRRKIGTRRHTRSLHGPLAARGTSKFSWCRRLLAGPAVRANNSELRAARHTELAHDLPHMNFDGTFPHPAGAQWPCSCRLDSGVRGPPASSLLDCDFWLRLPNLF